MIHGSTDKQTTWCGEPCVFNSWSVDHDTVECVACLRAAISMGCAACKRRKAALRE